MDSVKRKSDGDTLLSALQFPETSVDSIFHNIVDRQLHLNVNGIVSIFHNAPRIYSLIRHL